MIHTLRSATTVVTIDRTGAEMTSVVCRGKERLWQNEDGLWSRHAPLLFPVCGRCGVTVDGTAYPIKPHGFLRDALFEPVAESEDSVTLAFSDTPDTRRAYPFAFTFLVTYTLTAETVTIKTEVRAADRDVPFSLGGHDSFALDGPVGDYVLRFPGREELRHLVHDGVGCLTGESVDYGTTDVLPLPADFLREGRTLIFDGIKNRSVTLETKDGAPVARVDFPDFGRLLVWHPGDSHMICLEPWLNLPDPAGTPDVPFAEKSGVLIAPAGGSRTVWRSVTYL
ncbi:MAG: hypothetical protein J6125_00760 [Clostridia bacterium]|nr:hypothetical protein [Clostridia bacterium]